MKKPTNLAEAMAYVTSHHGFSPDKYPVVKKLDTWEQKMFEVNHCLLLIQTNIYDFLNELRLISPGDNLVGPESKLRDSSVGLLIDLLIFAYVMEIPNYEEVVPVKAKYQGDWLECLTPLNVIAAECAQFNRTSNYNNELLRVSVLALWKQFAGRVAREEMPWKMDKLIALIPQYMGNE